MILLSPVCHMHYFLLALPVVLGLIGRAWERRGFPRLGPGLALLLGINLVANVLPRLPGLQVLRDLGLVTYATLLLWLVAVVALRRGARPAPALAPADHPRASGLAA
jgi:hypothetical protein